MAVADRLGQAAIPENLSTAPSSRLSVSKSLPAQPRKPQTETAPVQAASTSPGTSRVHPGTTPVGGVLHSPTHHCRCACSSRKKGTRVPERSRPSVRDTIRSTPHITRPRSAGMKKCPLCAVDIKTPLSSAGFVETSSPCTRGLCIGSLWTFSSEDCGAGSPPGGVVEIDHAVAQDGRLLETSKMRVDDDV